MIVITTDGTSGFNFIQSDNPFWSLIRRLIKVPTKETIECQKYKPNIIAKKGIIDDLIIIDFNQMILKWFKHII